MLNSAQSLATAFGLDRYTYRTYAGISIRKDGLDHRFGRQLLRPIRGRNSIPRHAKSTSREKPREQWTYIDVPPIVSSQMYGIR
jgi:hypothetical protein